MFVIVIKLCQLCDKIHKNTLLDEAVKVKAQFLKLYTPSVAGSNPRLLILFHVNDIPLSIRKNC